MNNKFETLLLWFSRILFGVVFIFSGFVKAVDPLGSTYKFQDYFLAFNMEWMFPIALPLAILLSTLEFVTGITVLLGIRMKESAWAGLLFMLFFTPLTLFIALTDPVPHCGCFGDALIISNWETFYKNIVILAFTIFIFIKRKKVKPFITSQKDWWAVGALAVLITAFSVYCLRNLPVMDFRPWKVGNNVFELLQPQQEQIAEYTFIYKNTETGEEKEFAVDNLPSDPWEFSDRKEHIIQEFIDAPINNFFVQDVYGDDYTEAYLSNPDYHFLVVAYNLDLTNKKAFTERINTFVSKAEDEDYHVIGITGSSFETIDKFRHEVQASYPFYQSDGVGLKTIIRSNPGVVMLKNGIVIDKWHFRNLPSFEEIKTTVMEKNQSKD